MNIDELTNLIENDRENHLTKELASLLIQAHNDWPNENLRTIQEFINSLKAYFGDRMTLEEIEAISFNGTNAWQIESGSSIREIILKSNMQNGVSTFEAIVNNINNYYKKKK